MLLLLFLFVCVFFVVFVVFEVTTCQFLVVHLCVCCVFVACLLLCGVCVVMVGGYLSGGLFPHPDLLCTMPFDVVRRCPLCVISIETSVIQFLVEVIVYHPHCFVSHIVFFPPTSFLNYLHTSPLGSDSSLFQQFSLLTRDSREFLSSHSLPPPALQISHNDRCCVSFASSYVCIDGHIVGVHGLCGHPETKKAALSSFL